MSTSRLLKITNDFKRRLIAQEDQAQAALNAAHAHTLAAIQPALNKLYDEIAQKMIDGQTIPPSFVYERLRLEHIQLLIQKSIDNFAALSLQQTRMQQHLGVQLGLQAGMQQLNATIPAGVSYTFGVPSTKAINNLVGATQAGSPLADLFNGFGQEAANGASKALISGVSLGWNPRRIAPQVQQQLGISRNRALTLVRNESLRCYRSAALETYRANGDVVDQWRWTCSKSSRTCIACIMMDGTLHPLSEEFSGHVQDRCSPVPVTKDWGEILSPLGIDTSDLEDTRINIPSGEDWFHQQDESTQRAIFGSNAMYSAWQDGKFDLSDVVGYNHDKDWGSSVKVKSLKELTK